MPKLTTKDIKQGQWAQLKWSNYLPREVVPFDPDNLMQWTRFDMAMYITVFLFHKKKSLIKNVHLLWTLSSAIWYIFGRKRCLQSSKKNVQWNIYKKNYCVCLCMLGNTYAKTVDRKNSLSEIITQPINATHINKPSKWNSCNNVKLYWWSGSFIILPYHIHLMSRLKLCNLDSLVNLAIVMGLCVWSVLKALPGPFIQKRITYLYENDAYRFTTHMLFYALLFAIFIL